MPELYMPPTYNHPDTVMSNQSSLIFMLVIIVLIACAIWWDQRWVVQCEEIGVASVCRKCKKDYKGAIRAPQYIGTPCEKCGRR